MLRAPRALLVLLTLIALVGSACATEAAENPLAADDRAGEVEVDPDDGEAELDEPIQPDSEADDAGAPTSDEVIRAALKDVNGFWDRTFPEVYDVPWVPLAGGFWAYGPDGELPPCGPTPFEYSDIAGNAFYCPADDLIAWDNVNLMPGMYEEFGGFTLGIIMAHEFAHAVQDRSGTRGDTIMLELQADCLAGAWTADVDDGGAASFELTLDDLDRAVAGFLTLRDGVGTSATDPAAHGTGFDRIGAFSDGFNLGADHCAELPDRYRSGDLVIVEVPFTSQEDFERGGNLPLADLLPAALDDLEDFWTVLFDELGESWTPVTDVVLVDPATDEVDCGSDTLVGQALDGAGFYCVPDDTIYLDGAGLIPALNEIGDYAVATELARQYAYAAQVRLGSSDNSLASNLQADCFAGLYASSGFLANRPNQVLTLSPGDLDEAVIAFLQTSDSAETGGEEQMTVGTAFQRFDAFRSGFMEGTVACDALLEG
ncbi:MAG: neutral zinc metallopeptidase [Acidimicrobiales bacterium]